MYYDVKLCQADNMPNNNTTNRFISVFCHLAASLARSRLYIFLVFIFKMDWNGHNFLACLRASKSICFNLVAYRHRRPIYMLILLHNTCTTKHKEWGKAQGNDVDVEHCYKLLARCVFRLSTFGFSSILFDSWEIESANMTSSGWLSQHNLYSIYIVIV